MRLVTIALGLAWVAPAAGQGVLTYHNGQSRHGAYTVPRLTQAAAATMTLDPRFKASVQGTVNAQPLFWHPKGGTAELIVATENNIIYALNPSTGAVIWQQALPAPAPLSQLGCGNIDPEGITGTPVIDPATGTLYAGAVTYTGGTVRQTIYALALDTGTVRAGWPLDVQAALASAGVTFSSTHQGERSALLMFGGRVFAAYGGRSGDCLPYNGTVIEVNPANAKLMANWQTRAAAGGIWSQGGIAADATSMYVTTGNTIGAQNYGDGESVVRLKPGLAHSTHDSDFYAPANWLNLDQEDADLGGTEALPVNLATGGNHKAPRVIAFGKDGNAYLLNRAILGGIGGAADIVKVSNSAIITAPAVYGTATSDRVAFTNRSPVGCSTSGIMMLNLVPKGNSPITVAWCAAVSGRGSPIITTTDGTANPIVWVVGAQGDGRLHGFDAVTGTVLYDSGNVTLSGLQSFATILVAENRFYIAAANTVYAFTFTPG